jgi:hypothetical protein
MLGVVAGDSDSDEECGFSEASLMPVHVVEY